MSHNEDGMAGAPTSNGADGFRRAAGSAWDRFRGLPMWAQVVLWFLAWPAIAALLLARNARLGAVGPALAAAVLVFGGALWWGALFDGDAERTVELADDEVAADEPTEETEPTEDPDPSPEEDETEESEPAERAEDRQQEEEAEDDEAEGADEASDAEEEESEGSGGERAEEEEDEEQVAQAEREREEEPEPAQEPADCGAGHVDVNTASTEELQRIIHIGPSRADTVVGMRPFDSVRDLTRLSGIGDSRIADVLEEGVACAGPDFEAPPEPEPEPDDGSCASGTVDINSAGAGELQRIIHIGPARAEDVIASRPFSSVSDLTRVDGIAGQRIADIEAEGIACAG